MGFVCLQDNRLNPFPMMQMCSLIRLRKTNTKIAEDKSILCVNHAAFNSVSVILRRILGKFPVLLFCLA